MIRNRIINASLGRCNLTVHSKRTFVIVAVTGCYRAVPAANPTFGWSELRSCDMEGYSTDFSDIYKYRDSASV